jgi:hypothetical protein
MANFIFFVDLVVFVIVIACAASLLRRGAKRRVVLPDSDVVHACVKQSETCGKLSMAASTQSDDDRLSAVFLMLPRLGHRAGQIQRTESAALDDRSKRP